MSQPESDKEKIIEGIVYQIPGKKYNIKKLNKKNEQGIR